MTEEKEEIWMTEEVAIGEMIEEAGEVQEVAAVEIDEAAVVAATEEVPVLAEEAADLVVEVVVKEVVVAQGDKDKKRLKIEV